MLAAKFTSCQLVVVTHDERFFWYLKELLAPADWHVSPGQVDHPLQIQTGALRYTYSQYEYIEWLLEAADLLGGGRGGEQRPPGGIAMLETINPLPFMLGLPPPRGANLWSGWEVPMRPASEYLADVEYVLIPKIPPAPDWTAALVRHYGSYLAKQFHPAANTPSWILLARSGP